MIRLGSIYACIAGDHRYGTTLEVRLRHGDPTAHPSNDTSLTVVQLVVRETNPIGGMDGPGGTYDNEKIVDMFEVNSSLKVNRRSWATRIVKAVRMVIERDRVGVIKKYGKPTKRFAWRVEDLESERVGVRHGLSVDACLAAIDLALLEREHAAREAV